jgi:1,4-alpha-glucan branching enzyme
MIAEESTAFAGVSAPTDFGGLGFGFKWNMGWMHDSLQYIQREPIHRKYHHGEITFSMLYAYDEKFVLPISHDEVVHGKGSLINKMPGDGWQKLANVRNYLGFMWTHPGKKLLFMGGEFGQYSEWSEARTLDWYLTEHSQHQGLQLFVSELNQVYRHHPELWELDHDPAGFRWIDAGNADQNILSFIRSDSKSNQLIVINNFSNQGYFDFRIGVPAAGEYSEVLNSDENRFGGSGVSNSAISSDEISSHSLPHSISIKIPPLATLILRKN